MKKENLPGNRVLAGSVIVFIISALTAFTALSILNSPSVNVGEPEIESMNLTVDSDSNIATAEFFNKSLDIMREDGLNATYYLDFDRDGSFDSRLEDLKRDGRVHVRQELITLGGEDFEFSFRYKDNSSKEGDDFLRLYMVKKTGR